MNAETLDRLMMDRALGAMEGDVAALLDAYLEASPQAAARARQTRETVDLARRALGSPGAGDAPPPAYPRLRVQAAARARRRRGLLKQAAALAAVLVIGAALGALVSSGRLPPKVSPRSVAFLPQPEGPPWPLSAAVARADGGEGGFWSAGRLWNRRSQAAGAPPVSPLRRTPNSAQAPGGES
jgi:hypothetical protein